MVTIISDNIISPLGTTSEDNYLNVKAGCTGIRTYDSLFGIDGKISCSKIDDALIDSELNAVVGYDDHYTRLEKLALISATKAICNAKIDASSPDVKFYLSTTKGNVGLLDEGIIDSPKLYLHNTARLIANHFGNHTMPLTISNACISGLNAIITASRELEAGRIKYAVITGVDVLSKFVVSGFTCLKSLSPKPCRPFDIDRNGLNLGEAAATVVLKKTDGEDGGLHFINGSIRNDAYHISSPSRTAEGSFNALNDILQDFDKEQLAFVNAHGTATFFNDEMESVALDRARLNNTPVNAYKGYFGHTLGAAGVLETIISKYSIYDNTVIKTLGYEQLGTSRKISVASENVSTDKEYFVKLISGFGGANAAALFKKGGAK
jgi:3-oxoacyl-[acyl-carrier-protein] synthase-1